MAARCKVQYGKKVARIDVTERTIHFDDGSTVGYELLLSTLSLNRMVEFDQPGYQGMARPSDVGACGKHRGYKGEKLSG